jgi:outer membrane protein W
MTAAALVLGLVATPRASAQQSVNFYLGGFTPRSLDARGTDDVLFQNGNFLAFDVRDFNGATAGGEYLFALTDNVEAGVGLGIYSHTVPAAYTDWVNPDGSDIVTDMKLRVVPITATFRWLPIGRRAGLVPYVGAGVGIFAWRYSESGDFVDFTDNSIFRDSFAASGTSVGPVVLGGVRVPIGPVDVGGEIRYQSGHGDLPASQGFAGSRIDLGGFNYLAVVNVRF